MWDVQTTLVWVDGRQELLEDLSLQVRLLLRLLVDDNERTLDDYGALEDLFGRVLSSPRCM